MLREEKEGVEDEGRGGGGWVFYSQVGVPHIGTYEERLLQ